MKEFIIQLEVYTAGAEAIDGSDRRELEEFVEELSNFRTIPRRSGDGHMWVYAYDALASLPLDDTVRRMIDELPRVDALLKLKCVEGAVVSVGILSDSYVTSADLGSETIAVFAAKLKGVGLQFVHYPTDFGEDREADAKA